MTHEIYPTRWPVEHPDRIQLYSIATPNGQKVGIMLEELGVPYEGHKVHIGQNDQFDEGYLKINPNNKIPTLIDPEGPTGEPIAIMETGAILMYLAQKFQRFIPDDPALHWETVQWVFFQMASVGPMFGQFGHFHKFARDKTQDDYGVTRYTNEAKRLLNVLNTRLEGRTFLVGETFTIADMATVPWINALDFYDGKSVLDYDSFTHIQPWIDRCMARPGVQRGVQVLPF